MFSDARLRWRSLTSTGEWLGALLVVSVILVLAAGMASLLFDYEDVWKVGFGWLVAELLAVLAIFLSERSSARGLAKIMKEIEQEERATTSGLDVEPAPPMSSDPIRPR